MPLPIINPKQSTNLEFINIGWLLSGSLQTLCLEHIIGDLDILEELVSQTETSATSEALMAEYAAAVLAKEPLRLAALYALDVRVFDAWGVWSFEGQDAWGRNLRDWLGSLGDESVRVQFDDVRFALHTEMGWISDIVTYSAVDTTGHVVRSMQNRLSWLLIKEMGRWVIAHEHTSSPISFENQTAILHRE